MGIRKSFTYEGQRYFIRAADETDYQVKKALKIKELEENAKIVRRKTTCAKWAKDWTETFRPNATSKWKRSLDCVLEAFCKDYGRFPLNKITQKNIQLWANSLAGLSQGTYDRYIDTIQSFFETALENGLITQNPVKGIKTPVVLEPLKRRPITDFERQLILKVAGYHRLGPFLKMMLFCGLRTMEVAALQGQDIDLKNRLIHVRNNIDYNGRLKEPKTAAGVRDVPIVDSYYEELKAMDLQPYQFVFTTVTGKRYTNNTFQREWKSFKLCMEAEHPYSVAPDLVPYCLRHTFCTDLQDAGVPINVAKVLMGHSSIKMTAQIYTHHTDRSIESAREKMNAYASGTPSEPAENLTENVYYLSRLG